MRLAFNFLVLSFLLTSCTSIETYRLADDFGETKIIVRPVEGIEKIRVRRVRVASAENLKTMVVNHLNYRIDFFRQSKDPYFGTNRWSDECLRRNAIGTLKEDSGDTFFRATATAEEASLKTETCQPNSIDVVQLVGGCWREKIFYEITVAGTKSARARFKCSGDVQF